MYTFEKNGLVICKPDSEVSEAEKDHLIYARVVSVDRSKDEVVLDRYLKEGQVHYQYYSKQSPKLPLMRLENEGYYQPMTDEEILKFRDGLVKLVASPYQADRLDNVDVSATFEVVNERAEEIIRERENSGHKFSKKSDIERD